MKVGLQINRFDWEGGDSKIGKTITHVAKKGEEVGFDSEWVMDHFFQIQYIGPNTDPMLEAYTTLGFLAGATNRVMLGTMVTGVIYRAPALLIKAVTALDVLSGGRAYFGVGAGWNEDEAVGLGLTSPIESGRFERLEETLKIAKAMWAGDESPIHGKHFSLERPLSRPQPVKKPHPPILIGGGGEQKTLRLVAQYGDACNLFNSPELGHKLEVLKNHCVDVGRNYDEIEKTVLMAMDVNKAASDIGPVLKRAEELAGLGIHHIIFANAKEVDMKAFDVFGTDLLPALAAF
ncbi:MAG TPA: LLM class F420-dependent oxidoreductase [Candidatus Saccharimonadia bacterium]|nr:LLM class F420-dependent oxidoreductase [Candidatus Saccharimonadia bacterium]